jgi:two-component system chemotaxis response regulator CheY
VVLGKLVGNQDFHIDLPQGKRMDVRQNRTRWRRLASVGCLWHQRAPLEKLDWGACNGIGKSLHCGPMETGSEASKEQSKPAAKNKKLRVMVVDDQPAVCDVVADTIEYAGHEIIGKAKDGAEAVVRAKELLPDLIVMDVLMPRMNGVEAMKAILAAGSTKRILLMSGEYRSLGVTRDEMMREGAAGFMEKPFNVTELFSLLDRWSGEELA